MEAKTVQNVVDDLRTGYQNIVSVPLACQLINMAVTELVSLYSTAAIPVDIDMEAVEGGEAQIIPNMGIVKVTSQSKSYKTYTADSNSITFKDKGTYKVTAIIAPVDVLSASDDIPIHMAYHSCIVMYVANKIIQPDNPNATNNDQFYGLSQEIHNRLSRIKNYGRSIKPRVWR